MKLTLPTGRTVDLRAPAESTPPERPPNGPLFAEARVLFVERMGLAIDDYALVDFHALRAIAMHEGWLDEEEIEIQCINCGRVLRVRPCAAMPLGPFVEGALDDAELDARLPVDEPHSLGDSTVVLRAVTVKEAQPLFAAAAAESLVIDDAVVRALGVVALGDERSPSAIARALRDATDETWDAFARLYLELHYPLRLAGVVRCDGCGARNDVDAPYEREIGLERHERAVAKRFVRFPVFAARARAIARRTFAPEHEALISLVVEGGVAAVDDGGIPLLGGYMPASEGDAMHPSRPHEIAVYYRTFRAAFEEEEAFDWNAELEETIEHEYEHFLAELRGDDPMDEEERQEIDAEAARLHGKRTLVRAEVRGLGADLADFFRRTWILWVIAVLVSLLAFYGDR